MAYRQKMSQGDALAHEWRVTIKSEGAAQLLSAEATAKAVVVRPASEAERAQGLETVTVEQDATVNAASGVVSCVLGAGAYAGAGLIRAAMRVSSSGSTVTVARMTAQVVDDAS